jgi:hypothetical protein
VNAEANLHDITIRDLVIEGAAQSVPASDPNQDRRERARPTAPPRAGIVLAAAPASRLRRLRLEHVTVRNCTLDGVAIRGAAQVVIACCDFSDNGSGVLPGVGPQHNLVISEVEGCEVTGSRLDTSPGGCGLALGQGRDVILSDNEAARNSLDGLRATQIQNLRVRGNLVEGNIGSGIVLSALTDGCRDIDVRQNMSRNNGDYGLEIGHAIRGTIRDNKLADNGCAEQIRVAESEDISAD